MNKTITVKGTGKALAKPDTIEISMNLKSLNKDYEKAMKIAALDIDSIKISLEKVGFNKSDIKTTNFNVNAEYDRVRDAYDNYKKVFRGYNVSHSLLIRFDFDTKRLAETLYSISQSNAKPEFDIRFTVKDSSAIKEEMLVSATLNAKKIAETLCSASGSKLRELIAIDYSWGEINLYSRTRFNDSCYKDCYSHTIDIEPDDIDVSDTVTFVWGIE